MRTVAVIQARMGSSRLPGKVLLPLAGVPVIQQVYDRVLSITSLDDVVVATTVSEKDDELFAYCQSGNIPVTRGSERDVLDRYCQSAEEFDAEAVMRITSDCPFLDPRESAKVLTAFLETEHCDYASNIDPRFLPRGLDTEVVSTDTLQKLRCSTREPDDREHVTLFVRNHKADFTTVSIRPRAEDRDLSGYRWTLDYKEDYRSLAAIAERLTRRKQFGYLEEIMAVLEEHPEIVRFERSVDEGPLRGDDS